MVEIAAQINPASRASSKAVTLTVEDVGKKPMNRWAEPVATAVANHSRTYTTFWINLVDAFWARNGDFHSNRNMLKWSQHLRYHDARRLAFCRYYPGSRVCKLTKQRLLAFRDSCRRVLECYRALRLVLRTWIYPSRRDSCFLLPLT